MPKIFNLIETRLFEAFLTSDVEHLHYCSCLFRNMLIVNVEQNTAHLLLNATAFIKFSRFSYGFYWMCITARGTCYMDTDFRCLTNFLKQEDQTTRIMMLQ